MAKPERICLACGELKPLTEFVRAGKGSHRARCRPCWAAQRREKRNSCPENIKHDRELKNQWNKRNRGKVRAQRRANWKLLRQTIIHLYGGCCACCGETIPEFLAVDHIDGGGMKDILSKFKHKNSWYWWLAEQYRPGYRILCHNCNLGRSFYKTGVCPHELYKKKVV